MAAINYAAVKPRYSHGEQPNMRPNDKIRCPSCGKTLSNKSFYKTNNTTKFHDGYLPECKTCLTLLIDDTDPLTFLPIIADIDVPYIPAEWRALLVKKEPGATSILGKYLTKMRLNQWKKYRWLDSETLAAEAAASLLDSLIATPVNTGAQAVGPGSLSRPSASIETGNESTGNSEDSNSDGGVVFLSQAEAEKKVDELLSFQDLKDKGRPAPKDQLGRLLPKEDQELNVYGLTAETSKTGLTTDQIRQLQIDWGPDYSEDEYLKMAADFEEMLQSYIIQDPIAIQNAKTIVKMNCKLNKFLNIDDVDSVSKLSRQLDTFIKSANLAPVQQKERSQSTFSISQLAYLIEKEGGFIPTFYADKPNDKIDQILADMQEYTASLIQSAEGIDFEQMVAETKSLTSIPEDEDVDEFAAFEADILGGE